MAAYKLILARYRHALLEFDGASESYIADVVTDF